MIRLKNSIDFERKVKHWIPLHDKKLATVNYVIFQVCNSSNFKKSGELYPIPGVHRETNPICSFGEKMG